MASWMNVRTCKDVMCVLASSLLMVCQSTQKYSLLMHLFNYLLVLGYKFTTVVV